MYFTSKACKRNSDVRNQILEVEVELGVQLWKYYGVRNMVSGILRYRLPGRSNHSSALVPLTECKPYGLHS